MIGIHSCQHHTGHIFTLQWCLLPVKSFPPQEIIPHKGVSKVGFWLNLPIGLPLASCFWHTTWALVIFSALESNISAFTYWYPHSGVTSGSSSNMGNVLAFCDSSLYGSYCGMSSTPSSTKSLNSVQGPSFWCRDAMNELRLALHSFPSHSSWVSAWYLWRTWPFFLMIFAVKVGPISMLGPKYLCTFYAIISYTLTDDHLS